MKRILLEVAAVALLAGSAVADLTNGSFETGDLTGWRSVPNGGDVSVVASHSQGDNGSGPSSWTPTDGSWFALLTAGDADEPVRLYQDFSALAGQVVRFDYFWDAGDYYNDSGRGVIRVTMGPDEVIFEESVATGGGL